MSGIQLGGGRPAWIKGYKRKKSPERWSYLLSALTVSLFLLSTWSLVPARDRIVVRGESMVLVADFEVGRFGTGKLYFDDPIDVAIGDDDEVFILDSGNHRIQVMDKNGRFLSKWGSRGEDSGQFEEPIALAVSPDREFLVVLDSDADRVQKFDMDGNFLLSFGEGGIRKGKFEDPVDMTVDSLNYVYVLDRKGKKILKYHNSGAFVEEWGSRGRGEREFVDPVTLAYSDELNGLIYVLDAGRKALLIFHRDGDYREFIDLSDVLGPTVESLKLEADSDDNLFILDGGSGKLIRLDKRKISVFNLRGETDQPEAPAGLAIDSEDRVYISELVRNRLYRFPIEVE